MHRPDQAVEVSTECFPNIGRRGRTRRVVKGAFATAATIAVFAALLVRDAAPLMFLLLAPLIGSAAVLFLQAKEKT